MPDSRPVLSIVVPLYNEAENLDYLFERLERVCDRLQVSYEIICIDDGSRDGTLNQLRAHHHRNPAIKVLGLSRNFGKELALSAGLDYASGDAVVPIDADLQDPPELLELLMAKWRQGYDVVLATRRSRAGESWLKRLTASGFYKTIGRMSPISIPSNTGDFRLMDRRVVEVLQQMPERTRFMKGLFAWVGFRQTAVEYDRQPRYRGRTSWNYWRLWNFAVDGLTSFSLLPLKVWSYVGLLISALAFSYATFLVVRTVLFGVDLPGFASIMVAILFIGGIQLISLGVLGEYLGRVYEEVKGRPLYIVRDRYGFEGDRLPSGFKDDVSR
ncbi:glycosyltransferase family 2 protein [Synechococcus sp. PCC 7336]|uniref:glycosyltransferase family 2 protein n=1 Tax=Synechococcus sp. PCC 7336 TaxID=195250 RepID=UPI00056DEEEF|nr:glycosyltransferase family 2 protein [Synechococcus sp. PCC 7336]